MNKDEKIPVCPHCGKKMNKWNSPSWTDWDAYFLFVCFNDDCPYFVRGWDLLEKQQNVHASYRHAEHPETGKTFPLVVNTKDARKDGIVEE